MQNHNRWLKISDSTPDDFSEYVVNTFDVYSATRKFFDTNFNGAVVNEDNLSTNGYVEISLDGLAYFFKVLLNAVFGKSLIHVTMSTENLDFSITASWKNCCDIGQKSKNELKNVARLSGFELSIDESGEHCCVTLKAQLKAQKHISLYAISSQKLYEAYIRVFFL